MKIEEYYKKHKIGVINLKKSFRRIRKTIELIDAKSCKILDVDCNDATISKF